MRTGVLIMKNKTITNEDLCNGCKHRQLLRPPAGVAWEVPALCVRGWTYSRVCMSVISQCKDYEMKAPT